MLCMLLLLRLPQMQMLSAQALWISLLFSISRSYVEGKLDNATGSDILTRTQADSRYNQKLVFMLSTPPMITI